MKEKLKEIANDETGKKLLRNPFAAKVIKKYLKEDKSPINYMLANLIPEMNFMGTHRLNPRSKFFK